MELASNFSSTPVEPPVSKSFSISWDESTSSTQTYQLLPEIQQIYEHIPREQTAHIAFIKRDLGMLYYLWEDYDKARGYLEQALSIVEHSLIAEHPEIAIIQNNLASVYSLFQNYEVHLKNRKYLTS